MREISVQVFDDLDYHRDKSRNTAAVTLAVGLDGTWRELDLTRENEKVVRDMLGQLMSLGHAPDETPGLAQRRPYTKPDPDRISFLDGLRQWCHETNQRNSSGNGWAYQTNDTLKYYYSTGLVARYRAYLAQQDAPPGGDDPETQ